MIKGVLYGYEFVIWTFGTSVYSSIAESRALNCIFLRSIREYRMNRKKRVVRVF